MRLIVRYERVREMAANMVETRLVYLADREANQVSCDSEGSGKNIHKIKRRATLLLMCLHVFFGGAEIEALYGN